MFSIIDNRLDAVKAVRRTMSDAARQTVTITETRELVDAIMALGAYQYDLKRIKLDSAHKAHIDQLSYYPS